MPVNFFSIADFRDSLSSLCRKDRDGYSSCPMDICNLLKNLSFDDIWELNFRIREYENIRVIKIRITNSLQHLSAADGFRLIICCNKKEQSVAFLNVYPKKGKLGQLDQPKEAYKRQLKSYSEDLKQKRLVRHDISNFLAPISQD